MDQAVGVDQLDGRCRGVQPLRRRTEAGAAYVDQQRTQALAAIDAIIAEADGLMIARGDLAIEIPAENVPLAQKMIIKKCNMLGKPVITATQMLESMIKSPTPTRAEVSDIANAIIDGTDAIMLSEETTLGEYPVKAVEIMSKIAVKLENNIFHNALSKSLQSKDVEGVAESVTLSAVRTAERVGAKFIVSITNRGTSAFLASRHKPRQPILVFTPNQKTFNQSLLSYGCHPVHLKWSNNFTEALDTIRDYCLKNKLAKKSDRVVISSGMPFGEKIETSMMLVETL